MKVRVVLAASLVLAGALSAQRSHTSEDDQPTFPAGAEFHFIRAEYTDLPQFHRGFGFASRSARGNGWWVVDWPDADNHFTIGVGRLTRIATGDPRHLSLTDPHLFDYPWIYATQVGWWGLHEDEILQLREYLLRGGFIMVDDFWGPGSEQWAVFRETMERVLPGRHILDVTPRDSVMHVVYDIEEKDRTFIPGSRHLRIGLNGNATVQQPLGTTPAWRTINDDHDRMMVSVNYNTDIGDAWEFADAPEYPEHMTALAYRYGINYVVYAMTH